MVVLNVKPVKLNSTRLKSLLTMKNIPHTGDQVVAGNSNVK
ncbi:MAG: hypothetical protein WA461_15400 [Nitrososphaeraceae archaeon]